MKRRPVFSPWANERQVGLHHKDTADTLMSTAVYKPIKAEAPLERLFIDFQLNQAAPTFFDNKKNLPARFPSSSQLLRPRADSDVRELNQLRFRPGSEWRCSARYGPAVPLIGHERGVSRKRLGFFPPTMARALRRAYCQPAVSHKIKDKQAKPSGFSNNNLGFCL